MLSITGRVLSVACRHDGTFGVTLGPGPDCFWYAATQPPNLGAEVTVEAEEASRRELAWHGRAGSITRLARTRSRVRAQAARVVAPQWFERVSASMARPLRGYQVEGAAWLSAELAAGRGAILGDDMGLGKTAQAIAALCATGLLPALIVCPTSLKVNWTREIAWAVQRPTVEILSRRTGRPPQGADFTIINYGLLRYREAQLGAAPFRCIVFDEGQEIKEPKPTPHHVAAVATRLAGWVRRAIVLTGTPIMNRPAEAWRLLHIADPIAWPSYEDFALRYCLAPEPDEVVSPKRIVTSFGRVERKDELRARVQSTMLRRLKADVAKDLPPRSRQSVCVDLDALDMADYRAAERDVVSWLRAQGQGALANEAMHARALVKLSKLRRLAAMGKLREAVPRYLRNWFDRSAPDPLVIFAYHREVLAGILTICAALGLRTASISGSDKPYRRQAAVDAFMEGRADVFVTPIKSGGTGLNLQRAADGLFCERMWQPTLLWQAEARYHRIGQTRPTTSTYLDAVGTVDEHMAAVCEGKQEIIRAVVDDEPEPLILRTALNVMERMLA